MRSLMSYVMLFNQESAPAWTPASITGLQLWLDASDAATLFQDSAGTTPAAATNAPVGYWADKSGNGRHGIQAVENRRPLLKTALQNGKSVVLFNGTSTTDSLAISATIAAGDFSVYFACNPTMIPASATSFLLDTETGRLVFGLQDGTNPNTGFFDGSWKAGDTSVTGAQLLSFILVGGTNQAAIYRSGAQLGTALTYTQKAFGSKTALGSYNGQSTAFFLGSMFEVLLYTGGHTSDQRQQVESYLAAKWGVTLGP